MKHPHILTVLAFLAACTPVTETSDSDDIPDTDSDEVTDTLPDPAAYYISLNSDILADGTLDFDGDDSSFAQPAINQSGTASMEGALRINQNFGGGWTEGLVGNVDLSVDFDAETLDGTADNFAFYQVSNCSNGTMYSGCSSTKVVDASGCLLYTSPSPRDA